MRTSLRRAVVVALVAVAAATAGTAPARAATPPPALFTKCTAIVSFNSVQYQTCEDYYGVNDLGQHIWGYRFAMYNGGPSSTTFQVDEGYYKGDGRTSKLKDSEISTVGLASHAVFREYPGSHMVTCTPGYWYQAYNRISFTVGGLPVPGPTAWGYTFKCT